MSEHRLEDFAHRIELRVRWGDLDRMGHVNNANFFTYAESGRIAYFEELERTDPSFWQTHGIILAQIGCDFVEQLRYPATLAIGTRVTKLGRSSVGVLSVLFDDGRVAAVVKGVVVWFDYAAQKSMPVPEHVRRWIRERERIKPDES